MSGKSSSQKNPLNFIKHGIWGILILIALIIFFVPHRIVKEPERIIGISIGYHGEQISLFDESAVKILLSNVRCQRIFGQRLTSVGTIEVNFLYNNQPVHIILGEDNLCYHSSDDFLMYAIVDAELVLSQFENIIQRYA